MNEIVSAEQKLLETGVLVPFRVVDTHREVTPDKENVFVRVELLIDDGEPDNDPADILDWGAFGLLFTISSLSFHDARPRGMSGVNYLEHDEFTVADFFECLSYGARGLHLHVDYIRGRSVKTDVTVRPDGTVTLTTWGRGMSAERWLDRLQGKKRISEVSSVE